jgi:hypothetical protein
MNYETRTVSVMVLPEGEAIFCEHGTTIEVCDESAGEFVVVSQHATPGYGKVAFEQSNWPAVRDAIERMLGECRA